MQTLITYDIKSKHNEVKLAMKAKGYFDYWDKNGNSVYLPNTTLWKNDVGPVTAMIDIKSVTTFLSVKLERAVAVEFNRWDDIPGSPIEE